MSGPAEAGHYPRLDFFTRSEAFALRGQTYPTDPTYLTYPTHPTYLTYPTHPTYLTHPTHPTHPTSIIVIT